MNYPDALNRVNEWSFLATELQLYLDTHPADAQAFAALQNALSERKAAVEAYEECHGALSADGLLGAGGYNWVERPFPFE